jgi:hypothetical protein
VAVVTVVTDAGVRARRAHCALLFLVGCCEGISIEMEMDRVRVFRSQVSETYQVRVGDYAHVAGTYVAALEGAANHIIRERQASGSWLRFMLSA